MSRLCVPVGLVVVLVPAVAASAAETLRVRFEPGESYETVMTQAMEMTMEGGPTPKMTTITKNVFAGRADAVEVNDDGNYVLDMSVDRILIEMQLPDPFGGDPSLMKWDSAEESSEVPPGPLATMVPALRPLIGVKSRVTMTPQGETVEVNFDDDAFEEMKSAVPALGPSPGEVMRNMSEASGLNLPAGPVSPDDAWPYERVIEMPLGGMTMKGESRYVGRDEDGIDTIVSELTPEMNLNLPAGAQMESKKSEMRITLSVDSGTGLPVRSETTHLMENVINAGAVQMDQKMKSVMTFEYRPLSSD